MGICSSRQQSGREADYIHEDGKDQKHKHGDINRKQKAGISSKTHQPGYEGQKQPLTDIQDKGPDRPANQQPGTHTQENRSNQAVNQQPGFNGQDKRRSQAANQQPGTNGQDKRQSQAVNQQPRTNGQDKRQSQAVNQQSGTNNEAKRQSQAVNQHPGTNNEVKRRSQAVNQQLGTNGQDKRQSQAVDQQPGTNGQDKRQSQAVNQQPVTNVQDKKSDHAANQHTRLENAKREIDYLKTENSTLKSSKSRLEWKVQDLEKEKNDLILRLSAIVSAKMTDGNADIADLSDQNRPTNLASQYQELYDNQWTDVFTHLVTLKYTEPEAIKVLLDILLVSFDVCSQKVKELWSIIDQFSLDGMISVTVKKELTDGLKRNFLQGQAAIRETALREIKKHLKLQDNVIKDLSTYINSVIDVTWLMVIQDPSLYLDQDTWRKINAPFDKRLYREYTASGDTVEFVVWPALFVQKDGGLLSKGTAQGKKTDVGDQKQLQADPKKEEHLKKTPEVVQQLSNSPDNRHDKQDFQARKQTESKPSTEHTDTHGYDNAPPKVQVQRPNQNEVENPVKHVDDDKSEGKGNNKIELSMWQRDSFNQTKDGSHQTHTPMMKGRATQIQVGSSSQQKENKFSQSVHAQPSSVRQVDQETTKTAYKTVTVGSSLQQEQKIPPKSVHSQSSSVGQYQKTTTAANRTVTVGSTSQQEQKIPTDSVHTHPYSAKQDVQKTATATTRIEPVGSASQQEQKIPTDSVQTHPSSTKQDVQKKTTVATRTGPVGSASQQEQKIPSSSVNTNPFVRQDQKATQTATRTGPVGSASTNITTGVDGQKKGVNNMTYRM